MRSFNREAILAILTLSFREGVRRRVFLVVAILTAVFLGLYALGANYAFDETRASFFSEQVLTDDLALTGGTLMGLAMFATLFLGAVLGVFLTIGLVRGDADAGLLQPLVVRPLGRATMLLARFGGAAMFTGAYALGVYLLALLITGAVGDWWPDHIIGPGLALAFAVIIIVAISTLISVWLSANAQGIAVLMIFGAGLTAGLLGQIGEALGTPKLADLGETASRALPFEGLYQAGLYALTSETGGITGIVINLGPFGGSQEGGLGLVIWSTVYLAVVLAVAVWGFRARDL